MRLSVIFSLILACVSISAGQENQQNPVKEILQWNEIEGVACKAVAGEIIAGLSGDAIVVFDGQTLGVLEREERKKYAWYKDLKIDFPSLGAAMVSTDMGIICIGGTDSDGCSSEVFALKWDKKKKELKRAVDLLLPDFPRPICFAGAVKVGDIIYLAGGKAELAGKANNEFWALDLSKKSDEKSFKWKQISGWQGQGRLRPVITGQNNGHLDSIYIFGGYTDHNAPATSYVKDVYRFIPVIYKNEKDSKDIWKKMNDIPEHVARSLPVSLPIGQGHILSFCGGRHQNPGLYAYHTITDTWVKMGAMPQGRNIAAVLPWGEEAAVVTIETTTSVVKVYETRPKEAKGTFNFLDYSGMIIYLVSLVIIGFYFSKQEQNTDEYFLGGRRVPAWAAALSVLGTGVSAITFLSIPAQVYGRDWTFYVGELVGFVFPLSAVILFIPFFRRLNVTTAYEYLEKRFNYPVRAYGGFVFILAQLGRLMVVLYLPSLALSSVTGVNIYLCIIVIGLLCTLYTWLGGIEAVIWTDVLQVIILFGGVLICIFVIITGLDDGVGQVLKVGAANGKFNLGKLTGGLSTDSFWIIAIGCMFWNLQVPVNQDLVQRYLVTENEKEAKKSAWLGWIFQVPVCIAFYILGTCLYVHFKSKPVELNPVLTMDSVLPWFISNNLHFGVAGLVVSAIFAASMSTIDSSINSVATVIVTDFYRRFKRDVKDITCLKLAKNLTLALGIFCTGMACVMAHWSEQINSVLVYYWSLNALLASSLAGVFLLGILCDRPHGIGAFVGVIGGSAALYCTKAYTDWSIFTYPVVGMIVTFVVGYAATVMIPVKTKSVVGFTIRTLQKKREVQ